MKNRPGSSPNFADERRNAIAEVRAIYREVDSRPLQRNCTRLTECCQFRLTGRTPQLTRGEALVAAQALRATGRKVLPESEDGRCPLLHANGKCLIYHDRPFGCRTHFCPAAGGPAPRSNVLDLIRRLEVIDQKLENYGPRPLAVAITDALK